MSMCITRKYSADKKICRVTFILPEYYAEGIKKACLVGEFNEWNTTNLRMKRVHGKFTRTLKLQSNNKYQFRYLIDDNNWKTDWDSDALVPVNTGTWYNSMIVV